MTTGNDKRKMILAIGAMMMMNSDNRYVCNSYMYERYKKLFSEEQSNSMKENWNNEHFRQQRLKKYRDLWDDLSYRKRRTERMKDLWNDPTLSSKRKAAWEKSAKHTLWNSEKSKEINKKLWSDPSHRALRRTQQREWANKIKICEVCGKNVKNGIHSLYHGKRCKFNKETSLENFFS